MTRSYSISIFGVLLFGAWGLFGIQEVVAQKATAEVQVRSPIKEQASGGYPPFDSVVELFGQFREAEGALRFTLESDAEVVAVRFMTEVLRDGEPIGRRMRAPMPYFPGEMVVCPETWDFISLFHEAANEDGRLPGGEYEVRLSVLGAEEEPLGRPGRFRFSVPR